MPLPLTVSCFSKIQIGLPFWYRLARVVLEKGPLDVCVRVRVCVTLDRVSALHHTWTFEIVHPEKFLRIGPGLTDILPRRGGGASSDRSRARRHSLNVNNVFRTARGGRWSTDHALNWCGVNMAAAASRTIDHGSECMSVLSRNISPSMFIISISKNIPRNPQNTVKQNRQIFSPQYWLKTTKNLRNTRLIAWTQQHVQRRLVGLYVLY